MGSTDTSVSPGSVSLFSVCAAAPRPILIWKPKEQILLEVCAIPVARGHSHHLPLPLGRWGWQGKDSDSSSL